MEKAEWDQHVQRFEAALDAKMPKTGDPLLDVQRNLLRISTGITTPEEVGHPFYRADDGTVGIIATGTVFEYIIEEIEGTKDN